MQDGNCVGRVPKNSVSFNKLMESTLFSNTEYSYREGASQPVMACMKFNNNIIENTCYSRSSPSGNWCSPLGISCCLVGSEIKTLPIMALHDSEAVKPADRCLLRLA